VVHNLSNNIYIIIYYVRNCIADDIGDIPVTSDEVISTLGKHAYGTGVPAVFFCKIKSESRS